MRKTLPIGRQDFGGIRRSGDLYVDKTEWIYRLIEGGRYYFLARPRRFGKSLTLSTLAYLFAGERELFEGLWIVERWDWATTHPVLHLAFNKYNTRDQPLATALTKALAEQAARFGVGLHGDFPSEQFAYLLEDVHARHGQVVLLVDEYDKPLIDYLDRDELPRAQEHQRELKSFYSIIKSSDVHIRFLMIVGVSKFSKVSVFSDLNNLRDITLSPHFAALTGITEAELATYFLTDIAAIAAAQQVAAADLLARIRNWYNGYSFDGDAFVYNPFSLLSFFADGKFHNYWFATGTPTFLLKLIRERGLYVLEQQHVGLVAFEAYDLHRINLVPLLFQTGYLTIKEYDPEFELYTLDYPNREVRISMLQYLLAAYAQQPVEAGTLTVKQLAVALRSGRLEKVRAILHDTIRQVPYQLLAGAEESTYHAIVHVLFTYLGQYIQSEVSVAQGRLDSAVVTDDMVYLFEFKLDGSAGDALRQIQQRDYAAAYRGSGKPIVAIGVNFSSTERGVTGWETVVL